MDTVQLFKNLRSKTGVIVTPSLGAGKLHLSGAGLHLMWSKGHAPK